MPDIVEPEVRYGMGGENSHWYANVDGKVLCAYEIKGANGKWRKTTLKDAREHGWYPGITTITRLLAAPGLERWKRQQMMYAALTSPHISEIKDHNELFRVLEKEAAEEGKLAAQKGTAIHAAVERYFQDGFVTDGFEDYLVGVEEELKRLTAWISHPNHSFINEWKTEEAVTHPLGFGTRIDLYSTELNCIVDFKGKEFGPEDQVKGWPEQAMQLAAGREMIYLPSVNITYKEPMRCINIFISRNNPGLVKAFEWPEKDIEKAWEEFKCILEFWQIRNNMRPF